ncbi:hypothetical protein BK131_19140 [Paenibacillus amylolyticus]|uniref:Glycosyltransferase 2-like domain-containing protein n=1 Tax=Paenibacillus amylolyticus TaxID=1451 RepID=A0A1R1BQG5_PAEAM|nr:glycosyltransferase family 2 protein [Paenibacillus amylolyticus]OMF12120.1 hypothetical protein BK131_19140 [Paenibacillus amylolyticus]
MVRITVIIPTQDRLQDLHRCIKGIQDNDLKLLHEIIVVDDGSETTISPLVESFNLPIRVIRNERPKGAAICRNIAGMSVESNVIAFLDDDAVPTADWLSVIKRELLENRGGITGRVLRFDSGIVSAARQARYDMRYLSVSREQPVQFFSGGNSAVWTTLFKKVNGFNSLGSGGDNNFVIDIENQGFKIHFIPELIILHRNSKGLMKAVIEAYNSGKFHPKQVSLRDSVRNLAAVKQSAIGKTFWIASLNWSLNAIHLLGRIQKREIQLKNMK